MSEKPKSEARVAPADERPHADLWNRAVAEAYAEPERADVPSEPSASEEELDRHLRAAGFDLEAEDLEADATYDAMVAKLAAAPPPARALEEPLVEGAWTASTDVANDVRSPRRSNKVVWLAWAVAAAAATGGAAYVAGHRHPPEDVPKEERPVVNPPEAPTSPAPSAVRSAAPEPPPRPGEGKTKRRP